MAVLKILEYPDPRLRTKAQPVTAVTAEHRLLADATGRNWIRARRPELYGPMTVPTGNECDTRKLKFEE